MAHPPPPTPVRRDLARLIESEAPGEAHFATAAHLSLTETERRAWSALRDLKTQTKAGVSSFIERAELPVSAENRIASAAGHWRPEQLRDLGHRRPFRLVVGPDLTDHPDRPLTQLDRVPLRRTP